MEDNVSAEFDLKSIISLLWRNKSVFVVAFILSLLFSAYYISTSKRIYEAITTVELEKKAPASEVGGLFNNQGDQAQNLASMLTGIENTQDSDIIPMITGREFLLDFEKNYNVSEKLGYTYKFSEPKFISLLGILSFLGLYEVVAPTKEQGEETIINKIRSLLSLERFKYKQIKTKAYKIKIQHTDPYIAAYLANSITQHFFEFRETKKKQEFKDKILFVSSILSEAQASYIASQKALEDFLLKHPSFFDDNILQDSFSTTFPNIKRAADLVDLSSQRNELKLSIKKLQVLSLKNNLSAGDFDTVTNRGNMSNYFLREVEKFSSILSPSEDSVIQVKDKILDEISLLNSLLSKTEKFIEEREKDVSDDLDLGDTFYELKLATALNKNYVETTKTSLNTLSVKASSEATEKRQIYSLATPPINPSKPNVRYILMLYIAIFMVAATIFVFIKQFINPMIFDLKQIKKSYGFGETIRINKKSYFLNKRYSYNDSANLKGVSLGFFNALVEAGKVGCLIEVGKNRPSDEHLSSALAFLFSTLLAADKKYTICISEEFNSSNKPFDIGDSIEKSFDKKENSITNKELVTSGNEVSDINNFQFFPLKESYQKFEKMLIASPKNLKTEVQFSLIKNCDFFILFGRAGYFKREHLDQFITDASIIEEKCLGFVLVD